MTEHIFWEVTEMSDRLKYAVLERASAKESGNSDWIWSAKDEEKKANSSYERLRERLKELYRASAERERVQSLPQNIKAEIRKRQDRRKDAGTENAMPELDPKLKKIIEDTEASFRKIPGYKEAIEKGRQMGEEMFDWYSRTILEAKAIVYATVGQFDPQSIDELVVSTIKDVRKCRAKDGDQEDICLANLQERAIEQAR